jgi:hypothetical protein
MILVKDTLLTSIALLLWGCGHHVLMEDPSIESVEPSLICLDSLPATIEIGGDGMQPVAHNLLGEPELVLPAISLVRVRTERGEPVGVQEVVEIPADAGGEEPPFRWYSEELLQVDLLSAHGLRPGLHSITVQNPDGTTHTLTGALLLHRTPDIESVEVEVTSTPARALRITLTGGPFLLGPGSGPLLSLEGEDLSYPPVSTSDCASLAVQSVEIETCGSVVYELPGTMLDEDISGRPFRVAPFGESACTAHHDEGIDLAPCPAITSVEPRIVCAAEGDRSIAIHGTSLTFGVDVDPMVQVGDDLLEPTLESCTASGGERTCSTLTLAYPAAEVDEIETLEVRITDLVMEDHCLEPVAELSLAPPPAILEPDHGIEHDVSPSVIWVNGTFLMWEAALPLISFGGEEPGPVDDIYYCDYLTGMVGEASICRTILATVPAHLVVPGALIPFTVTAAPPIGCTSAVTGTVTVSEEP